MSWIQRPRTFSTYRLQPTSAARNSTTYASTSTSAIITSAAITAAAAAAAATRRSNGLQSHFLHPWSPNETYVGMCSAMMLLSSYSITVSNGLEN